MLEFSYCCNFIVKLTFFSPFGVFVVLLRLQNYNLFSYLQIFFDFFLLIACRSPPQSQNLFCLTPFSGGRVFRGPVPVVCWSCALMIICPQSDARAYIRAYTRARGFLDRNF